MRMSVNKLFPHLSEGQPNRLQGAYYLCPGVSRCLGCDASVVGTRDPDSGAAPHAVVPHQRVLQGGSEGVAQVETAGHVRRWQNHLESLAARPVLGPRPRLEVSLHRR